MKRMVYLNGVDYASIRDVIYRISMGKLKEVDEIAKALREF
ncbi:hypothetical protein [Vallitalea guaymasensis]|nr:hypothetical protein [Vallitalea guaymasensis]